MPLTRITVTGTHTSLGQTVNRKTFVYVDAVEVDGTGVASQIPVVMDLDGNKVLQGVDKVQVDAEGDWSLSLPATDDANLDPSGYAYRIRVVENGREVYSDLFTLPAATASPVSITDLVTAAGPIAASYVSLVGHLADPVDAHDASAISYAGSTNLAATNVEAALDELDSEKQSAAGLDAAVAAFVGDTDTDTGAALSTTYGLRGLARFRQKLATDAANAVVVLVGDSTSVGPSLSGEAMGVYTSLYAHTRPPMGRLQGMSTANFLDRAFGGITRVTYFSDSAKKAQLVADDPDLIIYSLGINDVRGGSTSLAQLEAGIESDVEWITANCPNADIVLRIPNSLTTDNVGSSNFLTPQTAQAAQDYTDLLRNAYLSFEGRWPHVVVWNAQDEIFGRICRASTDSRLMKDQLHPTKGRGYSLIGDRLARFIGNPRASHELTQVDWPSATRATYPYTVGDTIDRADSAGSIGTADSGQSYTVTGTWDVTSKKAGASVLSGGAAQARVDSGISDGEFGCTLSVHNSTGQNGIVLRYIDGSNYIIFWQSGVSYALITRTGGVTTSSYGNITVPAPANGDRIKVVAQGEHLTCFVNDAIVQSVTASGLHLTGTGFGFYTTNTAARFVDLYAKRLA